MKPALLALGLAACIGPPDRATLSGGHGWGGADGQLGGVKSVEQDLEANWVGASLEFPITYRERSLDACRRCDALLDQVQALRLEVAAKPEAPLPEKGEGFWIGSGSVATLAAVVAALMRFGVVPPIQPKEK